MISLWSKTNLQGSRKLGAARWLASVCGWLDGRGVRGTPGLGGDRSTTHI